MRIASAFGGARPVFSFELFPPKTAEGVQSLYRTVSEDLAPLEPAFLSVTYGAGGSTQDLTVELVSTIKRQFGLETMCHLTCVGHGAAELALVLDRLRDNGIENVLPLRGDPPQGQQRFERAPDGFAYAQELARFIRSGYEFCLGGACYPEGHPECVDLDDDVRHLREKVDAGAEFLITQLFFDAELYFDFVERARRSGIEAPIVPGILPVLSLPQIERFTALCGASIPPRLRSRLERCDGEQAVVAAGIEWATDQCAALLDGGAPGIHFYTLNRAHSVRRILEDLGRVTV